MKDCAERGIEIESAANPSLFKSTTPHGIFVRQIGGAVSEYDSRMAYEQLRNGAPFQKKIPLLKPLNPYGDSKNDFDKWAIVQNETPPKWIGFKFFNVYGPNEFHKGRMASVIFHSYNQIKEKGFVKLFRSHNPNYTDGGQLRDFVYVKDLVEVLYFAYTDSLKSGIYNLGSGQARTFLDLATATFNALNKPINIEFIDTPIDIRDKYQYFTEANMSKLISQGYNKPFTTLEEGVTDYVTNYLDGSRYF